VYLDVKLDGQLLGRITVELLPAAAPVGAARFRDLAVGRQGVGYRLSRFDGVFPVSLRSVFLGALGF
jgi:peptidyl-prolyl cis-trans isomerase B (cyclophilin B)